MSPAPEHSEPGTPERSDAMADIAVIGGSGLYSLFDPAASTTHTVSTPYGATSSPITIGMIGERRVAFLTRHGADHSTPPHLIGYRANIWALASLGVSAIVSSSAVGGLSPDYPPGTLVVTDQFIDRTWGRPDTFFDEGSVQHLPSANPFDSELRQHAIDALTAAGGEFAPRGTAVVIQGPRFSTRAESRWFRAAGGHTVNMTLYPEVSLAAELNIGTVNLSFVTDSDAGVDPSELPVGTVDADSVDAGLVFDRLAAAQPRIVAAITAIIESLPASFAPSTPIEAAAIAEVLARPVAS